MSTKQKKKNSQGPAFIISCRCYEREKYEKKLIPKLKPDVRDLVSSYSPSYKRSPLMSPNILSKIPEDIKLDKEENDD